MLQSKALLIKMGIVYMPFAIAMQSHDPLHGMKDKKQNKTKQTATTKQKKTYCRVATALDTVSRGIIR